MYNANDFTAFYEFLWIIQKFCNSRISFVNLTSYVVKNNIRNYVIVIHCTSFCAFLKNEKNKNKKKYETLPPFSWYVSTLGCRATSFLLKTRSPGVSSGQMVNFGRMSGWVDLGGT